jgi:hypothetical protein
LHAFVEEQGVNAKRKKLLKRGVELTEMAFFEPKTTYFPKNGTKKTLKKSEKKV